MTHSRLRVRQVLVLVSSQIALSWQFSGHFACPRTNSGHDGDTINPADNPPCSATKGLFTKAVGIFSFVVLRALFYPSCPRNTGSIHWFALYVAWFLNMVVLNIIWMSFFLKAQVQVIKSSVSLCQWYGIVHKAITKLSVVLMVQ